VIVGSFEVRGSPEWEMGVVSPFGFFISRKSQLLVKFFCEDLLRIQRRTSHRSSPLFEVYP